MRNTIYVIWIIFLLMSASMVIGHLGTSELHWTVNPISTYAADAPNDHWITLSMYLGALTLFGIALLTTKYHVLGDNLLKLFVPLIVGTAITGIFLIAGVEETIRTTDDIKKFSLDDIQQQAVHIAGWRIFFYSMISLLLILGGAVFFIEKSIKRRAIGFAIFCSAPIGFLLVSTKWYELIGFNQIGEGLIQRLTIFCLLFGIVLFMTWVSTRTKQLTPINH